MNTMPLLSSHPRFSVAPKKTFDSLQGAREARNPAVCPFSPFNLGYSEC